jgi:pimeloyl-ACP methyl ester carboxylesterase
VRRGWKILIGVAVVLAVLLAINTIVTDQQTKPAEVNVSGGQIVSLPGGDVQAVDTPPQRKRRAGTPIVLLHCFTCSLRWWDAIVPLLTDDHRVIRIDLLGFGGSAKPKSDYSMEEQASLVALALNKLRVEGAVVVGHSMGFDVATALAEQSSELVDRLVDVGAAPDPSFADVPFFAKLGFIPVLGEAMWRLVPDVAIREGYEELFAPGYDVPDDFGDMIVDDFRAMTYTSFDRGAAENDDFEEEQPLDVRVRTAAVPLLVIFGTEDQGADDPEAAAQAFRTVPGAQIAMVEDAGHSPNVEKPRETARLILDFAARAER